MGSKGEIKTVEKPKEEDKTKGEKKHEEEVKN